MTNISGKIFPEERALYNLHGLRLSECKFDGELDGESALKESGDLDIDRCYFNLRYPLWHCENVNISSSEMTEKCRAALWYSKNVAIKNSNLLGIKAVRECEGVSLENCKVISPEFGWKSCGLVLKNVDITSEYLFLMSKNIRLENVDFKGKYSFQYVENMTVENCRLDTKDAFWHTKNVVVKNSVVKGEYLGWYSQNLKLENCTIIGTQPLCYCEGLTLENCRMQETDLSFEYSNVNAVIEGEIMSVKNVKSGRVVADKIGEIILTDDSTIKCECEIITNN